MNAWAQRACAWSGIVCLVLFFLGFWVIAGFIPPPSPKDSVILWQAATFRPEWSPEIVQIFLPGSISVFFKDGPFAWNGLLTWYLPLTVFTAWIIVNTVLTLRAITREEREETELPAGAARSLV